MAFSYKDKEKEYIGKLEGQEFKPGDEYLGILENIKTTESATVIPHNVILMFCFTLSLPLTARN